MMLVYTVHFKMTFIDCWLRVDRTGFLFWTGIDALLATSIRSYSFDVHISEDYHIEVGPFPWPCQLCQRFDSVMAGQFLGVIMGVLGLGLGDQNRIRLNVQCMTYRSAWCENIYPTQCMCEYVNVYLEGSADGRTQLGTTHCPPITSWLYLCVECNSFIIDIVKGLLSGPKRPRNTS